MTKLIAIDGPAASGKSSAAREVAARLGWVYVNTGNMYRAATWAVLQAGADITDEAAILRAFANVNFCNAVEQGRNNVSINGQALDAELNSEAINAAVSHVARVPAIREELVAMQRALGKAHPCVMEGRDIGTVVFPDAMVKLYIDASEEVRAKRRGLQGLTDSVRQRDLLDSTRKTAPLAVAQDAVVIDSSTLTLSEVVDQVMELLRDRGLSIPAA
ncbi:MAG: (d)CMP kinase [Roseimicrobium sp.]